MDLKYCLEKGTVQFGCIESLIVGVFTPQTDEQSQIRVKSDRGIAHVCMLLEAAASNNLELKNQADSEWVYPPGPGKENQFELFLKKNVFVEIFSFDNTVCIDAYAAILPNKDSLPGIYHWTGEGETLEEAIQDLLKTEPKRMKTVSLVDGRFYKESA